jgi:hypothetical protein
MEKYLYDQEEEVMVKAAKLESIGFRAYLADKSKN